MSSEIHYNFTSVERSDKSRFQDSIGDLDSDSLWSTILKQLQPNTAYTIVVKAFNSEGSGPSSPPVTVTTLEDGMYLMELLKLISK